MFNLNRLIILGARFTLSSLLLVICASEALSQTPINAHPDRGLSPFGSYSVTDIENISLTNGGVNLAIPLAALPPIAGSKLSFTFKAYYSSKIWDTRTEDRRQPGGDQPPHPYYYVNIPSQSNLGGWRFSNRYQIESLSASNEYSIGNGASADDVLLQSYPWQKTFIVGPDGSSHELRPLGYPSFWGSDPSFYGYFKDSPNTTGQPMAYYSSDGSYIWTKIYPRTINSNLDDIFFEAYLPDGTRIAETMGGVQRIMDTNGNSIKIFSDGNGMHYQDELTGREIRFVCSSGTQCQVIYQTVGGVPETIDITLGVTEVRGVFYDVRTPDNCTYQEIFNDSISVIREIKFPQTVPGAPQQKFTFTYNSDATDPITVFYFPSCPSFGFSTYNNPSHGLGELSRVVTPTGVEVNYTYRYDGNFIIGDGSNAAANTIATKSVSHDGVTDNWTYGITEIRADVTNPDGSTISEDFYQHFMGYSSSLGTSGYGGLAYRINRSNKTLTEQKWTRLLFSGANEITDGNHKLVFNPVVDTEFTSLLEPDAGGNPVAVKMFAKKFQYDFNGNLLQTIEYDWFDPALVSRDANGVPTAVPPSATVLRVTNTSYHNSATTSNSGNVYAKRSLATGTPRILNAPQQITVGQSITQFSYDNQAYGMPPTLGNLTKVSSFDNQGDANTGNDRWLDVITSYDLRGNKASVTDSMGNITYFEYDNPALGLPNRVKVDPLNGTGQQTASTIYDASTGLVLSQTDANGQVTTIDYTNQLLGVVDPFGRPGIVYSPAVIVNGVSQRRKVVTAYEDNLHRVTLASDLNAEGDGLLKSRNTQDQLGRTVLVEQSENGSTYTIFSQTVFEQAGKFTFQSNPYRSASSPTDGWTRTTKDVLGRVVEVAAFSGTARPAYDAPCNAANNCTGRATNSFYSNQTTITDQAGKSRSSEADALGRLVNVTEDPQGLNYLTAYTYDAQGNLTQVTQGAQTRTFSYSTLSKLSSSTIPEVCQQQQTQCLPVTTTYRYNNNGNLESRTDGRGVVTTYGYDGLNRLISRTYSEKSPGAPWSPPVTFTYDTLANGKGRLTKVTTAGVSETRYTGYDSMGKVTGSEQTTDGVTYSMPNYRYDLAGNLISQTYPSGRVVETVYDNAGRIAGVKKQTGEYYIGAGAGESDRIKYSAHGSATDMKLGNSLWEHIIFNARLQPQLIGLGTSSTLSTPQDLNRFRVDYFYGTTDNNGNIRHQTISINPDAAGNYSTQMTQIYEYDTLNHLKSAREESMTSPCRDAGNAIIPCWKQTFNYDRFGNRSFDTANTSSGMVSSPLVADPATNRLATGQGSIHFDIAGNTDVDFNGHPFSYDGENKQVAYDGGAATGGANYYYDGDGRRVKKVVGTSLTTTVFVYNAMGQMVAEYSNVAPSGAGGTSYLTTDNLGTPRVITGTDGQVKARHDYLPFGEEIAYNVGGRSDTLKYIYGTGAADNLRQKFTQYERDVETGLDYAQARYYGSSLGRFTSPDPAMASASIENPQTWNRYVYVLNSPLRYADPLGLWEIDPNYEVTTEEKDGKKKVTVVKVILRKEEGDDVKSLAKQLKISEKDAQKILNTMDDKGGIRLSEAGGKIGSIFKAVESQLKSFEQTKIDHPEKGNDNGWDCSRTTATLAGWNPVEANSFGANGLDVKVGARAPGEQSGSYADNVSASKLTIGDMIRFAKSSTDRAEHWATFLMMNKSGEPVVFSKSGAKGPYEFGTPKQISERNGYGPVTPNSSNGDAKTGYYRKN